MIVVQTPLRISFLGGGTDFEAFYRQEEGMVVSTAIDKYVYIVLKERFDDKIYVNYSRKEIVDRVEELEHELIRESMKITGVWQGVEITTLADVPADGSGLGSSSSTTVGLIQALGAYQGEIKTAEELAQQACRIEIDILEKPIGKQDQYIAAYGNMRCISFMADGSVRVERLSMDSNTQRRLNQSLMLFYTNIARQSSDILKEQNDNIPNHMDVLRHLTALASKGRQCLVEGSLDEFGEIMHQGWELKKRLASGISNGAIEEMYTTARREGAIGGKITGAGGGGFLLLYVPAHKQEAVRQALGHLRELPFTFERDGTRIMLNAGR